MKQSLKNRSMFLLLSAMCVVCTLPVSGQFLQQGSKLVGTGAVGGAQEGWSAAISADGNTAIVGGDYDNSFAGAAWVYTRSGGVWTQQGSKLVGTGAVGVALQGYSVALSADGNTAIVGGTNDNSVLGAAWVYVRNAGVWTQQGSKLVGTGGILSSQAQGTSVSLSADGNTAMVGGAYDNSDVGAVWVYTRSGGVWTQQGDKLVGTGAVGDASQGWSVSLSADGKTAIVGGPFDNSAVGAAWVFTRSGGAWTQQGSKLVGPTAGTTGLAISVSLSADGNTAVLGGPANNSDIGGAWVFTRSNGVWMQQGDKLVGTGASGAAWQGSSVAISADGNTMIAGGQADNGGIGAAWVYTSARQPEIMAIADVPGDQGGQVRLTWKRSVYDSVHLSPQVISYGIFRKSPSMSLSGKASPRMPDVFASDTNLLGYDYLGEVRAYQLPQYQTVVPTLEDSSSSGTATTTFRIVANTEDIDQYHVSTPDSGHSVDNLSPIPPAGLVATAQPGPQVGLTWDSPSDPDVGEYLVYRSTLSGFSTDPAYYLGTSHTTAYTDVSPAIGLMNYYRLVAVDIHGNKSAPSAEASAPINAEQKFSVENNWNMVSVPQRVSDYTKSVLFPTATSNAFTYEDGYVAYGVLENGRGYWVKFSGAQDITQSGIERTEDTVDVKEGWNMMGALSVAIPTTNLSSVPGGIITSPVYQYTGGYNEVTTLQPGKGYWIKVAQSGLLIMTTKADMSDANRIRIQDDGERPPAPPGDHGNSLPTEFSLSQNYPNPFNPVTIIRYSLPSPGYVRLAVYDMLGREIKVLVDGVQDAGYKNVSFNADGLPSGEYTYRIKAGAFTEIKKMIVVK